MDSVQSSHLIETPELATGSTAFAAPPRSNDAPSFHKTCIEIFTDGSCIGNPGHGGWGAVILRRDVVTGEFLKSSERSGHEVSLTTNVKMEMTAACTALEGLGRVTDEPITVFCDLDLIPKAMNLWLSNWKAKGWKKSGGKTVENRDLWERLERAAAGRNVTWSWVRGHNGSVHNERADKLAYAASLKAGEIIRGR